MPRKTGDIGYKPREKRLVAEKKVLEARLLEKDAVIDELKEKLREARKR